MSLAPDPRQTIPRRAGKRFLHAGALTSVLAIALGCASRQPSVVGAAAVPGVVLHETHTQTQQMAPDTVVTYVTAHAVRVSHAHGDAILDVEHDRILLLDREQRTVRSETLAAWEERIRQALAAHGDASGPDGARRATAFERAGESVDIAGYTCTRYVLYTNRDLLGVREAVEQQLWVTTELELPAGAFAAYQRTLQILESVGLPVPVAYPNGVILRRETRTRPADALRREPGAIETSNVFRVESRTLPLELFSVPPGFRDASAAEAEATLPNAPPRPEP